MNVPDYIENHLAVVDYYGYWPSFHDANVSAYRAPSIEDPSLGFTLHTWRMTDKVDANGCYILRDHSLVSFRFDEIHEENLNSFQSDNILYNLSFLLSDDNASFRVELDSVIDRSGVFSARSGQVVEFIPCNPDGTTGQVVEADHP